MRAEWLLSSAEFSGEAMNVEIDGARALVLPTHLDLIHNLAHHHLGHWEAYNGMLDPNWLFEFALALAGLDEPARAALVTRLGHSPLLLAMLEFWLVAADAQFGTETRLISIGDVRGRWTSLRPPKTGFSRLEAIRAELAPTLASGRLRRVRSGSSSLGRLWLRAIKFEWAVKAWGHYYLTERWMLPWFNEPLALELDKGGRDRLMYCNDEPPTRPHS